MSLMFSLPASAKVCYLGKFNAVKNCSSGDVFGAIAKPVKAAAAQKSIASYCDHQATITLLEEEDSPRRYYFSCRFHPNDDAAKAEK